VQTRHLTFSGDGRQAFFPGDAQRTGALQRLARLVPHDLVGFCLVDDHVHVAGLWTDEALPQQRRRLLLGLRAAAACPVDPAHVRRVDSRSYLRWLVRYLLQQPLKHGLSEHPALWSGSFFQDLVGARHLKGLTLRLPDVLPRYRLRDAFEAVGLPPEPLLPLPDPDLPALSLPALCRAAATATCAPVALGRRTAQTVRARRVVAAMAPRAGFSSRATRDALGLSATALRRHRTLGPDPRDLAATRTRLALERRVAAVTPPGTPRGPATS